MSEIPAGPAGLRGIANLDRPASTPGNRPVSPARAVGSVKA